MSIYYYTINIVLVLLISIITVNSSKSNNNNNNINDLDIDSPYEQAIAFRYMYNQYSNNCINCGSQWYTLSQNIVSIQQSLSVPLPASVPVILLLGIDNSNLSINSLYTLNINNPSIPIIDPIVIQKFQFTSNINRIVLIPTNTADTDTNTNTAEFNLLIISIIPSAEQSLLTINIINFNSNTDTNTAAGILINTIQESIIIINNNDNDPINITSSVWINNNNNNLLYIGTSIGLYLYDLSSNSIIPQYNNISTAVNAITYSNKYSTVFIATEIQLFIETLSTTTTNSSSSLWHYEWIPIGGGGIFDSAITSLTFESYINSSNNDKLWVGMLAGVIQARPIIFSDNSRVHWQFNRINGIIADPGTNRHNPDVGLPINQITFIEFNTESNQIWLGSNYGAVRYDRAAINSYNKWRLFNSARYMPVDSLTPNVTSITLLPYSSNNNNNLASNTAIIHSSNGITILIFELWTLLQKAEYYQSTFIANNNPAHNKYGLVGSCNSESFGSMRTCIKGSDDNDGLWTSIYLASQAMKYSITQDTEVLNNAITQIDGLHNLNYYTGIIGYPARSIALLTDFGPTNNWYKSPINQLYQFKGDTSADEITGHMLVYQLIYTLFTDNQEYSVLGLDLLLNITNHIKSNNYYLVGEKAPAHTKWGFWNHLDLNDVLDNYQERSLNSLQILAWLLEAYIYTKNQSYLDSFTELLNYYHYDINLLNMRGQALCDLNFSDDELDYLNYFNALFSIKHLLLNNPDLAVNPIINKFYEYMQSGLELSMEYKLTEKSPFYNFIYCFSTTITNIGSAPIQDCNQLFYDSIWYLQRWSLELIMWPQYNSIRLDIQHNIDGECLAGRNHAQYSLKILPPDERIQNKWNSNPYDLNEGNGMHEDDPGAFLISYWGWKYLNTLL